MADTTATTAGSLWVTVRETARYSAVFALIGPLERVLVRYFGMNHAHIAMPSALWGYVLFHAHTAYPDLTPIATLVHALTFTLLYSGTSGGAALKMYMFYPAAVSLATTVAAWSKLLPKSSNSSASLFVVQMFSLVFMAQFARSLIYPAPFIPSFMNVDMFRNAMTPKWTIVQFASSACVIPGASQLEGAVLTRSGSTQWIVYLGGNGEVYEGANDSFADLGNALQANLFAFNHRGVARSTGGRVMSAADLVEDCVDAIRYLKETHGAQERDIILFGHSIGGGVAAQVAAHHCPEVSVIFDRSFSSLTDAANSFSRAVIPYPLVRGVVGSIFGEMNSVAAWDSIKHDRKVVTYHRNDAIIIFGECSLHTGLAAAGKTHQAIELTTRPGTMVRDAHNSPASAFDGYSHLVDAARRFGDSKSKRE